MPKFQFVQWEEIKSVVVFDADDVDHAEELMQDAMDWSDLPNAEIFHKNGSTNWESPEPEVGDNNA